MIEELLPEAIAEETMKIGPVEVDVVQLDDGRRLVSAEGLCALLTWLGYAPGPLGAEDETG